MLVEVCNISGQVPFFVKVSGSKLKIVPTCRQFSSWFLEKNPLITVSNPISIKRLIGLFLSNQTFD
jgi:hypothetical protein